MHRQGEHNSILCIFVDDADLYDLCVLVIRDNDVPSITFEAFMIWIWWSCSICLYLKGRWEFHGLKGSIPNPAHYNFFMSWHHHQLLFSFVFVRFLHDVAHLIKISTYGFYYFSSKPIINFLSLDESTPNAMYAYPPFVKNSFHEIHILPSLSYFLLCWRA